MGKCSLQPRNTNFDKLSIDNLDLAGLIMRPALLKTLSLAAELAGAVNIFLANGFKALNFLSLYILMPCSATSSSEVSSKLLPWSSCLFMVTVI